ncbi:MAG: P-II family nitrogen regulator [Candidatus Alcyoniella australis]|nr:P-II family nitrogen regulator [Candidatus Alcyoniella australis]
MAADHPVVGQQQGYKEVYRGRVIEVNEAFLQPTIDAIVQGARTGEIGDGKIFVLDMAQCIRIRTGETGREAIG